MKKATTAFLLSLVVAAGAETIQMPLGSPVHRPVSMKRSEGGAVRVCTYNIGWAAGSPSHPGCWASRRADVAALVCSNSPDVVAFQEVVPAQAGYLRGKMPEYGFAGEYRNEDRTSGQGNLVAWRRDRFKLVETRTFWLSETPDVPGSKSWGSGWRRTCTLAALREKRTGVRICVASVHLDCVSSLAKEEGMRLVLRRLPEFSAGAPVVLAGDFNSNETDTAPMLAAKEMTYALYASETPHTGPWGTTCAGCRRKLPPTSFADAQRVPLSERCTKEGTRRYGERVLFNASKAYVRQLDKSEQYNLLQPVYALNFVNKIFEPDMDGYYHYYRMVHAEDSGKVLEGLHLVFIELPKFKAKNLTEKKMQVLWLRFLTEIDEKSRSAPAELLDNPQTSQALEILEESAYSEAEMLDYDRYWDQVRRDKALMDERDAAHAELDAARAELDVTTAELDATTAELGETHAKLDAARAELDAATEKLLQDKLQTARNLKSMHLAVEQIATATGLTVEEIAKL